MLKVIDAALIASVKHEFGMTEVKHLTSESLSKPNLQIDYREIKSSVHFKGSIQKRILAKVFYNPSDAQDYANAFIEIREKFSDFFSGFIKVDENVIRFENYKDYIENNVLIGSFEFEYMKVIHDTDQEMMDSINMRMEEK